MPMPKPRTPGVIGIVVVSVLAALYLLYYGGWFVYALLILRTDSTLQGGLPGDPASAAAATQALMLNALIFGTIGVLYLLGAIALLMHKRMGLILAAIPHSIGLLWGMYNLIADRISLLVILSIVIELVVLYYIGIYLTREPVKNAFT